MQLAFSFDQTRCTGCHTCVVACKDWHDLPGGPFGFRFVSTREEGRFPDVRVSHLSLSCNHCGRPACADACPEEAIFKRKSDGIVLVDDRKCTGCRECESACPYEAIRFLPDEEAKAGKCDFCVSRIDNGESPICVAACPMRALDFGAINELSQKKDFVTTGTVLLPDIEETTASLLIKTRQRLSLCLESEPCS